MSATAKRNAWGIAALLMDGYRADAALYLHPGESELGMREVKSLICHRTALSGSG